MKKLCSLSLVLSLALCTSGVAAEADFARLFASAKAAQKVVVYGAKGVQDVRSQKEVKLIWKGDYIFREKAHELKEDKAKTVLETFGKVEGFSALQSPNPIGGFYPDLCLEWTVDGKSTLVLVSFSNCEIKAIGPDFKFHCDFRGKPQEELRNTLCMFIPSSPLDD